MANAFGFIAQFRRPSALDGLGALLTPEVFAAAWRRVHANGGCAGVDRETLRDVARAAPAVLTALRHELMSGAYCPRPLRPVAIPKASGGTRWLRIPSVRDRIAQTALLQAIVPPIDVRFDDDSYAYRPRRSVAQALERVRQLIAGGRPWILDADISSFFDQVPHRALLHALTAWIEAPSAIALIAVWLNAWGRNGIGLPQGAPLSPLLANLYLHPMDRLLRAGGFAAVRYADDFIVAEPSAESARQARSFVEALLNDLGLGLHLEKTRIVHAGEGFRFLGEDVRL